jgi:hypothetical protein
MSEVTREEKFLFDIQGFLILRGAIESELVKALDQAVVENEAIEHDESWAEGLFDRPLAESFKFGKHLTKDLGPEHHVRLNGLPRLDPIFDGLIAHPSIVPYLREFMDEPQLVNTWSISKYEGMKATGWHSGLRPYDYSVREGKIHTPMVNVVTMLTPNHSGDGCFAVIPGSHKKNFDVADRKKTKPEDPWSWSGLDTPGAIEITGDPGDVMIFTEALTHCGSDKTTARRRTTLQYNHVDSSRVAGAMKDYHNTRHYWMPPSIRDRFTPEQLEMTHWMDYTIPDRSIHGAEKITDLS